MWQCDVISVWCRCGLAHQLEDEDVVQVISDVCCRPLPLTSAWLLRFDACNDV